MLQTTSLKPIGNGGLLPISPYPYKGYIGKDIYIPLPYKFLPIREESYPPNLKMLQTIMSCPLASAEYNILKLKCMTKNVANDFGHAH